MQSPNLAQIILFDKIAVQKLLGKTMEKSLPKRSQSHHFQVLNYQ
jgi:hypothetical protein